jgi:hypothetical protein
MPSVFLDNDIAAKAAAYNLLGELADALSVGFGEIGLLGSLLFVISPKRLRSAADGEEAAHQRLSTFVGRAVTLEPDPGETLLAVKLEELALKNNVQLDIGESQLCAMAIERAAERLCTGDKRAVVAIECLYPLAPELTALAGKVEFLEAIIRSMNTHFGHDHIRGRVCASPGTDTAIEICFQCHNSKADESETERGLSSYIRAMIKRAPTVCAAR